MAERPNDLSSIDLREKAESFRTKDKVSTKFETYKSDGVVDTSLGLTKKLIDGVIGDAERVFTEEESIREIIKFNTTNPEVIFQKREDGAISAKNENLKREAEEYQQPEADLRFRKFKDLKVGRLAKRGLAWVASLVTSVGIAVGSAFPTVASAETPKPNTTIVESEDDWYFTAPPSQAALKEYGFTGKKSFETPTPNLDLTMPDPESYALKQRRIEEYKRLLKENGAQDINLEVFANTIDSVIESEIRKGFFDEDFIYPEKTILGNYCDIDQIFEVAKNPNMEIPEDWNWYPVFYKDSDGNRTNEVMFNYFFDKENPHLDRDEMYKIVDEYETLCPGFFKVMNKNSCYTFLHSQAGKKTVSVAKYGYGMTYINYSEKNQKKASIFISKIFDVEPIGVRCADLGGVYASDSVNGFFKSAATFENQAYLYRITKNKKFNQEKTYILYMKEYIKKALKVIPSKEAIYKLYMEATENEWITPYAASWEEIHSVVNIIDELRASD